MRIQICILTHLILAILAQENVKRNEQILEEVQIAVKEGKLQDALYGLNGIIAKEPGHMTATLERAKIHYKALNLVESLKDFEKISQTEAQKSNHPTALYHIAKIHATLGDVEQGMNSTSILLELEPKHTEGIALQNNLQTAHDLLGKILSNTNTTNNEVEWKQSKKWWDEISKLDDLGSRSIIFKESKAALLDKLKDYKGELKELNSILPLSKDQTSILLKMSKVQLKASTLDAAQKTVKRCTAIDPDHQECGKLQKRLKKIKTGVQEGFELLKGKVKKFSEGFKKSTDMLAYIDELELGPQASSYIINFRCQAAGITKRHKVALIACANMTEINDKNAEAWKYRGVAEFEVNADIEKSYEYIKKASDLNGKLPDIKKLLDEATKRNKEYQHKKTQKDYYAILGVDKQATKKEIQKAYRKAVKQKHPDMKRKHNPDITEAEVATAEKEFSDLRDAYEVLVDDEKRQMVDNGQDPLKQDQGFPGGGQRGGFNPFGGGGGGGGFEHVFSQHFGGGGGGFGGFPFGGGGGQQFHFSF